MTENAKNEKIKKPAADKPEPQKPKKSESLGKKAMTPNEQQPNLFGGEDEVYNVLQMQLTRVNGEIKSVDASIETKKKTRGNLIAERDKIHHAIQVMEKAAKLAKSK